MRSDESHVVHVRVVGTRRTQETHHGDCTTVRRKGSAPVCETRTCGVLATGLTELIARWKDHGVDAAALEATGIYWQARGRRSPRRASRHSC